MGKTDNSYRIKADIGNETVINLKIDRDIDFLEILTLQLSQKDLYKLHASNYGVIVGRVLANDGFGIPNVRLSVFIGLDDEDKNRSEIESIYPYKSATSYDKESRRYNLLPDTGRNDCYRIVGTFPNKRLVLDDDTQIEVFDNYWKYTTKTNSAGDYMIFGVPTGAQTVHADVDLSDIGILSQKPRDFVYKGYNVTSFDNASQFKESTNLDNLVQIIGQNQAVNVYPFWGDNDAEGNISITRSDINIAYKFETTCIFMGSIISDDQANNINHECSPTKNIGVNKLLTASEGEIEMIRHTLDGLVEEVQIQGNQLIDGDGIWCYQIPMNLDYVVTDEYGNIVPTDNPNKGIPTRTSVRFRVSLNETGSEGVSRHRAEYLIPNNPKPNDWVEKDVVTVNAPTYSSTDWRKIDSIYEFGSNTPKDCFRDLFWNKVYTVKNYIPRIQANKKANTQEYTSIRTVNYSESKLPFPFNNVRYRFPFIYVFLCILTTVIYVILAAVNALIATIDAIFYTIGCIISFGGCIFSKTIIPCITIELEDDMAGDGSTITYAPGCFMSSHHQDMAEFTDRMQRGLAQDSEVVNLDFNNDWINGCLYMPLWFWRKTKKKKYFFGLFSKKAVNKFCNASVVAKKLKLVQTSPTKIKEPDEFASNLHLKVSYVNLKYGVIYEKTNKDDLKIYYYTPITVTSDRGSNNLPYVRLFATDIILLGSMADCDLESYPKMFDRLPSSTANIPFLASTRIYNDDNETEDSVADNTLAISMTGMDWTHVAGRPPKQYASGLFLDLSCTSAKTFHKSIINARRLCELGVTFDGTYERVSVNSQGTMIKKEIEPDGLITRIEIEDLESRAMFATLNGNGLDCETYNPITGYKVYKFDYIYPISFDGYLAAAANQYTNGQTVDESNLSYLKFRFGTDGNYRWGYNNTFPMYNNSFYFYFGSIPGKTALEKFYKNFYADCFKNEKIPFSISIDAVPGDWCTQDAHFKATVPNIRTPYSFKLVDSIGKTVIEGAELEYPNLYFDLWNYNDDYDVWQFAQNCTKAEEYGLKEEEVRAKALSPGYFSVPTDEATDENGNTTEGYYNFYSVDLTNGMYTLQVTDSYGRVIEAEVNLNQTPIGLTSSSINLSDKYEAGNFIDKESSGKIIFSSITIDGSEYRFKANESIYSKVSDNGIYIFKVFKIKEEITTNPADGSEVYNYTLSGNDETGCDCEPVCYGDKTNECGVKYVQLEILPSNIENDFNVNGFADTVFNPLALPDDTVPYNEYNDTSIYGKDIDDQCCCLVFYMKTADEFNLEITEFCCGDPENGKLSDNVSASKITIANSEGIELTFAEVDYELIPKRNTNDSETLKDLYVNIQDPSEWENTFPTYSNDDNSADKWRKWVSGILDLNRAIRVLNGDPEFVDYTDEDKAPYLNSILNAIAFRLDCIMKVTAEISCEGKPVTLDFTYKGGANPKMYTAYPDYSDLNISNSNRNKLDKYIADDQIITIQGDYNYPTVVCDNYYTDTSVTTKDITNVGKKWILNTIFQTKELGHYGGVIDMNNPKKTAPKDIVALSVRDNYLTMNAITNKDNYFMAHTVDRRIDYDLHLAKGREFTILNKDKSSIFGGSALGYDENRNFSIITPVNDITQPNNYSDITTEYVYDIKDYRNLILNPNKKRRYYNLYFYTDTDVVTGYHSHLDKWEDKSAMDTFPILKLNEDIKLTGSTVASMFSWKLSSCSYDSKVKVGVEYTADNADGETTVDDNGGNTVLAYAQEGNLVEGTLSLLTSFTDVYNNFYDIVKNHYYNVNFNDYSTRTIKNVRFEYRILVDPVTACGVYTCAPILLKGNVADEEIITRISEGYENNFATGTTVNVVESYSGVYEGEYDTKYRYIVSKTDPDKKRLLDDTELRANISYELKLDGTFINFTGYPAIKREYIDESFKTSHLGRKIFVYELGPQIINIGDDFYWSYEIGKGSGANFSFNEYGEQIGLIPTDVDKPKKPAKNFSYIIVYVECMKENGTYVRDPNGDLIPDVGQDSAGNWLIGCDVQRSDVYVETYLLGIGTKNGRSVAKFIVPFYTVQSVDETEDDVAGGSDDGVDANLEVKPIYYNKKFMIDILFKRRSNGLYYKSWTKKDRGCKETY